MDSLFGMTLRELQEVTDGLGLPRFAAKQIASWMYQKRVQEIDDMTNLSKVAREQLSKKYTLSRTLPTADITSADGTVKYLFPVADKQYVETVYLPDKDRATLCVSTQAGCKMRCRFCMTGTLGFAAHLSAGEILNQVFSIPQSENLTNLVYMGEGEPCDNIDSVLQSLEILTSAWGCGWSPHRITVSSVGYIPGLKRLLDESECHIAISLHNPFSQERAEIMPIEKAYPIEDVIRLLKHYDWHHQRRISFEYICFGGQNDTARHAKELVRLLNTLECRVNLIRFHQNPDGEQIMPASNEQQMVWFRDYLTQKGITCTIRQSRGEDILAACGMLVNQLSH